MPAEITRNCWSEQLHNGSIKGALPIWAARLSAAQNQKEGNRIEVKIPKEIRAHRETIFFGLSARQFLCAVLAVGLAIDILPIPTEEAVREVQSRILGVETDITRWQQRQNRQNNFTATVPYDLEQTRTESKERLEDLTARDQRLMFACVTLVHIADSLEQQMGAGLLTGSQKSIIDRCTASVYQNYFHAKGALPMPLLSDWRTEVLKQPDPEAREIALAAELITEGSLNVFAHPTNVNIHNRIVVLDLYEMGEQLRPTALVVALEAIQNRVMENRKRGKYTWVFLDEVYLYFKYKYSGEILYRAWKRFRKYGAALTAASQNVEECLKSETARLMFANSEFLLLFNQAATDRAELSKLLHISDTQLGYITNAEASHGLLRMGGSIVPFVNTIPRDTELYRLVTTTPGEAR